MSITMWIAIGLAVAGIVGVIIGLHELSVVAPKQVWYIDMVREQYKFLKNMNDEFKK